MKFVKTILSCYVVHVFVPSFLDCFLSLCLSLSFLSPSLSLSHLIKKLYLVLLNRSFTKGNFKHYQFLKFWVINISMFEVIQEIDHANISIRRGNSYETMKF